MRSMNLDAVVAGALEIHGGRGKCAHQCSDLVRVEHVWSKQVPRGAQRRGGRRRVVGFSANALATEMHELADDPYTVSMDRVRAALQSLNYPLVVALDQRAQPKSRGWMNDDRPANDHRRTGARASLVVG